MPLLYDLLDESESRISSNSVKTVAESIGISSISEAAVRDVADKVNFRIRELIQEAKKFAEKSRRQKLTGDDIDKALKLKGFEPLYGFCTPDFIPFCYASGGGRELYFTEEKEIDLNDLIKAGTAKVPVDIAIKAHWLAVDGVQPAVPENPIFEDSKSEQQSAASKKKAQASSGAKAETVNLIKTYSSGEGPSVEHQFYFKEVTEACVGSDESKRSQALSSLSQDTGLQPLLPRVVLFIIEGVKVNVVTHNLAMLIYLSRMIKCLVDNPAVNLEKHLHELLPALVSCIASRQLCPRPDVDHHWALRDFAARVLVLLCKKHNTSLTNLQTRVIQVLVKTLKNPHAPLASWYGVLSAFSEFGPEVINTVAVPLMPIIGTRLRQISESVTFPSSPADKVAIDQLKSIAKKSLLACFKAYPRQWDDLMTPEEKFGEEIGDFFASIVIPALQQQSAAGPAAFARSNSSLSGFSSIFVSTSMASVNSSPAVTPRSQFLAQPLLQSAFQFP